jgi:hypothetical protein
MVAAEQNGFDPRGILAGLERNYVSYVLIGALARVIRGTNELTEGVDVCPSLTDFNRERLGEALDDLEARRVDRRRLVLEEALATERVMRLRTPLGELKLVPEPAPRSPISPACRPRSRTSLPTSAGERQSGLASGRSKARASCERSWSSSWVCSARSASSAAWASTSDSELDPAGEAPLGRASQFALAAQPALRSRLAAEELARPLSRPAQLSLEPLELAI